MQRKPLYYINSLVNGKWTDLNVNINYYINMNVLAKVCTYVCVRLLNSTTKSTPLSGMTHIFSQHKFTQIIK